MREEILGKLSMLRDTSSVDRDAANIRVLHREFRADDLQIVLSYHLARPDHPNAYLRQAFRQQASVLNMTTNQIILQSGLSATDYEAYCDLLSTTAFRMAGYLEKMKAPVRDDKSVDQGLNNYVHTFRYDFAIEAKRE